MTSRITRLERLIDTLTKAYLRRRRAGRPVAHLLPRCHRLTRAWLDARHRAGIA